MEEWKTYKLADICDLIPGFAFKSADFGDYEDRAIKIGDIQPPYVNYKTTSGVDVHHYTPSKLAKYIVRKGDFVLAMTGATIGKIGRYIHDTPAYLNQRVLLFKPHSSVNSKFVYYSLLSPLFQKYVLNHIDSETAQPNISGKSVSGFEINLPSRKMQDRIADLMSTIDDKIDLNTRINHNLEEQAQALYKSWFVDLEPFKDREFVNSELGLIPKGWSIQPFFNIAKLCSGGTPKTDRKEFWNGSIPFFTPKDIGSSTFCLSTEKRITEDGLSNCNSVLYKAFTTFITARGTVGKICMAGTPMAMNQTNYAICPISYIDDVVLFLITKQLVNNLKNKANGAVFDAITTRDFNGEMVLVAPHEIMDAFSAIVHPIYESILLNEMNNASLSSLRGTLLPKIMSGSLVIHEINS